MADGVNTPLIGISAYSEQARWRVWDAQAVLLPRPYTDRVSQAGGIPVLLPPVPGIAEAVGRLDGLILSGGGDIDPARYNAQPAPQTGSVREDRDTAEFSLLAAAMSRRLPVLGICRGLQVINVARGGSLHQHLPDAVGHDGHAPVPGAYGAHPVHVAHGSRLAAILGHDEVDVPISTPTHHHQAADRLGDGLTATAWATDGTIEAFELDPDVSPFVLAVQWHPEAGDDPSLFLALVDAARNRSPAPARA